ncbi:hypothetical protein Glove_440g17 [Diversispora epigaea]|uniref:Uncharacterized protein n=1 Tax=Diversispora epigaea TaxID=1348612 RepID=A0A397GZV4_9GLOM|nr:hypothetical protein Glove_440g17 [Diversispora epigaea]
MITLNKLLNSSVEESDAGEVQNKLRSSERKISDCFQTKDTEIANGAIGRKTKTNRHTSKYNEIQEKGKRIKRLKEDNEKLSKDLLKFQRSKILIGIAGSGKSTLANVITGINNCEY